ncbi:MAG TPA: dihydroorotase, partial [Chitinophagaceae bacterium]|nr:dihydroorotase [Chitinophagaceae bacterium]
PIGAITKNTDGRELAEMYDMKMSGAKAFSDGINSVQTAGIFLKALQYVKAFNGIIIQVPDDKSINPQGLMNEGIISTQLGMPGKPSIAEELIVERDIKLALYADSKIHFTGISTGCSLEQIKNAKENNGQISCSVTPYHLFFCDEELVQYDTNLKVNPPLRNTTDRDAIRKGISDGSIDCIATHHLPHEKDCKILEFENARNGMIGLETAYAVIRTAMPEITQETWVNLLSVNTRKIFQLPSAQIVEGNNATITLFNPDVKWTVTEKNIFSKSKNSPFLGRELTGKALGTLYGDSLNILS